MDLYGKKSSSIPQKIVILLIEITLLVVAYNILFGSWGATIYNIMSLPSPHGNPLRNSINFFFSCVVFLRFTFMMFFLMKRAIPLEEALSVPMAFSLYYIGFALFTVGTNTPFEGVDYVGILFFAAGSFINTFSELQRHYWKAIPENNGKLYTGGLFHYSMHINYFGDVMWVVGYAIISRNPWAWLVPLWLLGFFIFYNIPKLDGYMKNKYREQFAEYTRRTKKIVPFIY